MKHTFEPPVQNSQDVEIYSPIHVEPQLLVLPWEAAGDKPYHYQLQVCKKQHAQHRKAHSISVSRSVNLHSLGHR